MNTHPGTVRAGFERRFYTGAAVAVALIVFVGFARSYYLKGAFDSPALPGLLVHVHGAVMTLWFALFVAQAGLVAARRTDLHRRLGVVGALLAGLVVVIGTATAIGLARRVENVDGIPSKAFLVIPLGDLLLFTVLAGAGLLLRRRRDYHKRLMLLGSMGLLSAAVARIPLEFIASGGPLVFFGLTDLCMLPWVVVDTVRQRRLHPAFGWGALLIVVSQPLRLELAATSAWMRFAEWLVG